MCDIFIIYIAKYNRYNIHRYIIIFFMLQTRNNDKMLNSQSTSSVQRCFYNCIVHQYRLTNGYYTYHICYDDWIPPNLRGSEWEKQNVIIILGTYSSSLFTYPIDNRKSQVVVIRFGDDIQSIHPAYLHFKLHNPGLYRPRFRCWQVFTEIQ